MRVNIFEFFVNFGKFNEMLSSALALVTGGGSGIGKATCKVLAKESAQVIVTDLRGDAIENVKNSLEGKGHSALVMDVSKSDSVNGVLSEILKIYQKPPSIVVNCAGITRDSFLSNMTEEQFDEVIAVNLKGTYLVTQTFGKVLIENNMKGSIINIGSIIGKIGNIGQCNYSASKAGVELLTKSCAKEFGRYGIRCNVILPGFINTPMVEAVPEKVKNLFAKQIALGRLGEPEEVAQVIAFLASDKSSYVNGATIEVTGGGL